MLDSIYSLIRTIVTNVPGFTINDVLQTDWDMLIEILCKGDKQKAKKKEVMSLADFVGSL